MSEAVPKGTVLSGFDPHPREPTPASLMTYHVFLASPGDVDEERRAVRTFFEVYNRNFAGPRELEFKVVDWETYSSAGVGRPQKLITKQTLQRYSKSLALVIGIMAQRFGSKSGTHESGTEEEFECAVKSHDESGFPEVKWFFRDMEKLCFDPNDLKAGIEQWEKVKAFRERVETSKTVYSRSYKDLPGFQRLLQDDVGGWLNNPDRPWFKAGAPSVLSSPAWSLEVLETLSAQLNGDFARHMAAGEDLSPGQARARYVKGVLKLRGKTASVPPPPGRHEFPRSMKAPLGVSRESPTAKQAEREFPLGMEGPLEDFLVSDGMQLLVIGGGGSGKTTMLKHVAADGARRAVEDPRAPIFVYLRLASFDRDGGFDLLLDRLSIAAHLDRKEFEARWRDGRRPIVFLLDGVNEVARAHQPSCAQALRTLLQNSLPLHHYVITSRPGGEFEAMASDSTESGRLQVADVLEFGPEKVQGYLKAQGRTEIQSRISGALKDLASNPFLLWAITRTLDHSEDSGHKNRGSLFAALIDRYVFKEREQRKPKPRPTDYNYELVKKPVLAQLALKMLEDGVTVVTDGPELLQQLSKHLLALASEQEHDRALTLEAEVFMPKDYSPVSFLRETVDNGVLVREGDGLRFMHERVQEYFAAVALDTSTIEDLVRRVPQLKLARLDARGPMFEALVIWAGLSKQEKVTALVEHLQDRHALLAAHLAVEAGLPADQLQKLQHQFLSLTASEHEQRRQLGALGLAVVPSEEPEIVARLIELLHVGDLSNIVKQALEAVPTKNVLSALVKAATTRSEDVDCKEAELLREVAVEHSASVAEVVLQAWMAPDSRQERVARLAAFLDAKESYQTRRPVIRETLLIHSVDAELTGDLQRSAEIDALRQRAKQTMVEPPGIKRTAGAQFGRMTVARFQEQINESLAKLNPISRSRDKLAAAYTEKESAALEVVIRDGKPFERRVALEVLIKRGAPAAVAPLVEAALGDPQAEWLNALESFPREEVQRHLAQRIETLEGEVLEGARLLAALFADRPPRAVLEQVFNNSGNGLRALAVRAALRAGTEGIELLIEQLSNETDTEVLETCVNVLGQSRNPVALSHLLNLLFDPIARRYWPYREGDRVSDPDTGMSTSSDGWAVLIHNALADAGAADRTLERLELQLRPGRSGDVDRSIETVHEARRWLPEARATELLQRAMAYDNVEIRRWAQWSVACAGSTDAWRALLQTELDNPTHVIGLAQDAARHLGGTATDPATRHSLITAAQSVLRPTLVDSDLGRRAEALELIRRLPEQWIEAEWRREALATAELLMESGETDRKVLAVRALHRFADDGGDRVFMILLNNSDESVTREACKMLGDKTAPRLEEELESALRVGNGGTAQHIAGLLGRLLAYSDKLNAIRDSVGKWLDGDPDQCVAAMLALAMLHPGYGDAEGWEELGRRGRAAFQHHGLEDTWQRFAVHARSLSEEHRKFVYLVLEAFTEELEQLASLVTGAAELWPDDLRIVALDILVGIWRGNRDQAAEELKALDGQFHDKLYHVWVGDRFANLDRPHDALRHYRIAVENDPTDDVAQFKAGWFAFVTGDLEGGIESTRCSLKLQPTNATAQLNLGVALLARRDTVAAESAYRRGIALARRQAPAEARQVLEGALGDLSLLPELPRMGKDAVDRIRAWLQGERDRAGGEQRNS
jgi:tetratricopeptide (TPR) repeat protein